MLENLGKLGGLFAQAPRSEHQLANEKELRRVLAQLPSDNALKVLDEIVGWLQSLLAAQDMAEDALFDVVRQLDEAAQWHELRLTRDYLHSPRLAKADEKRLWTAIHDFWALLASAYEKCMARLAREDKVAEALKSQSGLLSGRLLHALGALQKWERLRYQTATDTIWLRLGLAFSAADQAGVAAKPLQLYPKMPTTTPQQEYLKVLALQASAIDCLLPVEIDLAERLVGHFISAFVFGPVSTAESVYWIDLARSQGPKRLASVPRRMVPTLRFFHPGKACERMQQLVADLERGVSLPAELALGQTYPVRALLPVLRHLITYWAPIPPQRKHTRHTVKHRMSVLIGFAGAMAACSGRAEQAHMESWVVENVSRGGFGLVIGDQPEAAPPLGTLLAMRPEEGDNWILGSVRRYQRAGEDAAHVGIQTLAREAVPVALRPQTPRAGETAATNILGLWLQDASEAGEVVLLLPPDNFDLRRNLVFVSNGVSVVLQPAILAAQAADHDIARYRMVR